MTRIETEPPKTFGEKFRAAHFGIKLAFQGRSRHFRHERDSIEIAGRDGDDIVLLAFPNGRLGIRTPEGDELLSNESAEDALGAYAYVTDPLVQGMDPFERNPFIDANRSQYEPKLIGAMLGVRERLAPEE